MVLVNGYLPGVGAASVSVDDAAVVDLAVRHLADMGHRRIGLAVGQVRYTPCIRRAAGFRVAMRRHVDADLTEAALDELTSYTTFTVEGGDEAAEPAARPRRHRVRLRLGHHRAGRDPDAPGSAGCGSPRTSPWSAATTR